MLNTIKFCSGIFTENSCDKEFFLQNKQKDLYAITRRSHSNCQHNRNSFVVVIVQNQTKKISQFFFKDCFQFAENIDFFIYFFDKFVFIFFLVSILLCTNKIRILLHRIEIQIFVRNILLFFFCVRGYY